VKQKRKTIAGILLAVAISLGYVRLRFMLVEFSYDLSSYRQKKSKLEQENRSLALELANLQNPSRIEKIARHELKLNVSAGDTKQIDLRKEKR
jgi:cell division protein FtsL